MKKLLSILFLLSLLSCKDVEIEKPVLFRTYSDLKVKDKQNKLTMISSDSQMKFDAPCAFVNVEGDTVIPFVKFSVWDTVNFHTYAIVKSSDGVVGINMKGEVMFDAYLWGDAQLENLSEGFFRIIRNGKIGFADESGKVVIPCQFACAEPFKNGKAKVALNCEVETDEMERFTMKSEVWYYIDKKGNKITSSQ